MSGLIEDFKSEHKRLMEMLSQVKEIGAVSPEGRSKLFSLKDYLLVHLQKEDEFLYPALKAASSADKRLARLLEVFAHDLEEVTGKATRFFSKHSTEGPDLVLAGDFGELFGAIKGRIRREENILFTEFEKLDR
jgi:iron-sulfur cluster repair protein YtfE (RIC family)